MKAKKQFGQNFLTSPSIAKDIAKNGNLKKKDVVLEVGPGKGILTRELLKSGAQVIAFEKDRELIPILKEKFNNEIKNNSLILINDDVFNFKKYGIVINKIVANIPYNITGKLIKFFFDLEKLPEKITLLVQKEVAKRITDKDKGSILSISAKIYSTPKYIKKVKASSFSPKPKIDSAIISFSKIKDMGPNKDRFFKILKRGFSKKRKLLKSNLGVDDNFLKRCNIGSNVRAEELSPEDWICLVNNHE